MPKLFPTCTPSTNAGDIVLSPSETKLIALTPISAESFRKFVITSLLITDLSFSCNIA